MSHLFALPSLELLLIVGRGVALVLGLLIFAWAFRRWRRTAMHDTQRVFEQLDLVRSELLIMKEVMHHAAQRGEAQMPASAPARETRFAVPTAGGVRGYEVAARMARNGASKEELIRNCGITAHEADLLVKLHGHRREAATANLAELIGRQPRTPEAVATASARQTAASETQRTPERNTVDNTPRSSAGQPRSRLVAVG